jgi:YaiO family outer membrane protein
MRFRQSLVFLFLSAVGCLGYAQQSAEDAKQLLQSGQVEESIVVYTQLLAASPHHSDLLLMRGLAYSRTKQWALAEQDLKEASIVSPNYVDVWTALGNVYRWNDQYERAAEVYAKLEELTPTDPQPHLLRARSLVELGDIQNAQHEVAQAQSLGAQEESINSVLAAINLKTQTNTTVDGYKWAASLSTSRSNTSIGSAEESTASLRRYTEYGSIALEKWDLQRYGNTDSALAVDAYPRLWEGAYANVRYQHSDSANLYPGTSWRAELFQNMGQGWELSGSHDYLGFDSHVKIDGVGLGKYWGNFYARWRYQRVQSDLSAGDGNRLLIRYYYEGDADHYLEANISNGRSADFGGVLLDSNASRSDARGLTIYHFVTHDWGVKASLTHSIDTSIAGNYENSLSVGLVRRW